MLDLTEFHTKSMHIINNSMELLFDKFSKTSIIAVPERTYNQQWGSSREDYQYSYGTGDDSKIVLQRVLCCFMSLIRFKL